MDTGGLPLPGGEETDKEKTRRRPLNAAGSIARESLGQTEEAHPRSTIERNGGRTLQSRRQPGLRTARRAVPPGNQAALLPHDGFPARSRRSGAGDLSARLAQLHELRRRIHASMAL